MRAYRVRQRQVAARMVDPALAPEAAAENDRLRERIAQLEDERDRLWGQVGRLQGRIRELERGDTSDASAATDVPRGLGRAERRRLARELARRQRCRAEGNSLSQDGV
jgi:predicted nuclease with TOPRIM domain